MRGRPSTVVTYFALEAIATGGQRAGWIDQTTNEDGLLQHATGAGYKLSQEFLHHQQEDNFAQRQHEYLQTDAAQFQNQPLG